MEKCKRCSSYAINHHCHGRDGSEPQHCDVCYWRNRAELATATLKTQTQIETTLAAIRNLRDAKGRHHTQIATKRLFALLPENA